MSRTSDKKTAYAKKKFAAWKKKTANAEYFRDKTSDSLLRRASGVLGGPSWDPFVTLGYVYCNRIIGGGTEDALVCCDYKTLVALTEMEVLAWASRSV